MCIHTYVLKTNRIILYICISSPVHRFMSFFILVAQHSIIWISIMYLTIVYWQTFGFHFFVIIYNVSVNIFVQISLYTCGILWGKFLEGVLLREQAIFNFFKCLLKAGFLTFIPFFILFCISSSNYYIPQDFCLSPSTILSDLNHLYVQSSHLS